MAHTPPPPVTKRVYRPREAAHYLGLSRATVYRLVAAGRLPPGLRLGPQSIGWRIEDLNEYLNACRVQHA